MPRILTFLLVISFLVSGCVVSPEPQPNPVPLQIVSTAETPVNVAYLLPSGTPSPLPIYEDFDPQRPPEPASSITIVHMQADDGFIEEMEAQLDQKRNSDGSWVKDAVPIISMIFMDKVLKNLTTEMCLGFSKNAITHIGSGERLARLGGWAAAEKLFADMKDGNIIMQALVYSKTGRRIGFLFKWAEEQFLFIISKESSSTIIRTAYYGDPLEIAAKEISNFLEISSSGDVLRGALYVERGFMPKIASILHLGSYVMDGAMVAETIMALRNFGLCLNKTMKDNPKYQEWVNKDRPKENNNSWHHYAYTDQELREDLALLENLGLVYRIQINGAEELALQIGVGSVVAGATVGGIIVLKTALIGSGTFIGQPGLILIGVAIPIP